MIPRTEVVGMLRVKNEVRWIEQCLKSLVPVCDEVLVMDDHSTDGTAALAGRIPGVSVLPSPFEGLDEARDKNWLLERAEQLQPSYIVAIDGDEMLSPLAMNELPEILRRPGGSCYSLRVWYLWNSVDQVRTDGVYGDFHRASIFRPDGTRFPQAGGANFHCGNVPIQLRQKRQVLELDLLHFGYMHSDDRLRKFDWYNAADPNNAREDGYRHMVIGDLFPADSRFMHGGPLYLERIGARA